MSPPWRVVIHMPKTFRAGTYWIRADLGGDPERHHALYSGVPKGWNVGFNANNKRDIPPHLKVVDMAPDDSQEHWGEFGEHIYNSEVVHLGSNKKAKIAARKGSGDDATSVEKDPEKPTTVFLLEQQILPDPSFWNWPEGEMRDALFAAFERRDVTAIGCLILVCFAAAGVEFKDFHIVIHDRDVDSEKWSDVQHAYVPVIKTIHIHAVGHYATKRGISPAKAESILGVPAGHVLIPENKHAYDNKMAYQIHKKDPDKYQYDISDVVTLVGESYEKYAMEHMHSWEVGRAKKARKNEAVTVDVDWLWEECFQGRINKETIDTTERYRRCHAAHSRRIDEALSSYQQKCFAELVKAFDEGKFHTSFVYIQGPSRRGKSALAQNLCAALKYRFGWTVKDLAASNSLDDYDGSDVIFMDDVSVGAMTGKAWLNLVDPNAAHPAPGRFHNKQRMAPRVVVLTTTKDPVEYFAFASKVGGDRNEALTQFIARILRAAMVIDYRDYWGMYSYAVPGLPAGVDPAFYNMRIEAPVLLDKPREFMVDVEDARSNKVRQRGYMLEHALQPVDDQMYSPIGAMLKLVDAIEAQNHDAVTYGTREELVEIMGRNYIYHITHDKEAGKPLTVMMPANFAELPPSIPDTETPQVAAQRAAEKRAAEEAARHKAELAEIRKKHPRARSREHVDVMSTPEYAEQVAAYEAAVVADYEARLEAFKRDVERVKSYDRFVKGGLLPTPTMTHDIERLRLSLGKERSYGYSGGYASYSNCPTEPKPDDFMSLAVRLAYEDARLNQVISIDAQFPDD